MFISAIKDARGITLVEMLIAMAVVMVGLLGSYSLLANIHATRTHNVGLVEAQQEARNVVEHIVRDLRESNMDQVWIEYTGEESNSIVFFTPRDENGAFTINHEMVEIGDGDNTQLVPVSSYGRPIWRRTVAYILDSYSNCLYRYESPQLISDINNVRFQLEGEIVSKNVDQMVFDRVNNMIAISIRTFTEPNTELGYLTNSYADFYTRVEFRN